MTDGPVTRDYKLGAGSRPERRGLVYFANYPMFLDICERDVLASARLPLADDLIDRRTLVRTPQRLPEQRLVARYAAHRDRAVAPRERRRPAPARKRPDVSSLGRSAHDGGHGAQDRACSRDRRLGSARVDSRGQSRRS
jgi:hypothetical protein